MQRFQVTAMKERRPIFERESGFWEHMGAYTGDLDATYFRGRKGLDLVLGSIGAGANLFLKAGEQVYKGAVGQKFNEPHGILGHTQADAWSLLGNAAKGHPLRAAGDLWSVLTSDLPMDGINLLTGNNLNEKRHSTRTEISQTLAA